MRLIDKLTPDHRFVQRKDLPPIESLNCQAPDPGFVASVVAQQLQPIVLIDHPFDGHKLVFGNRRVYACHLAEADGLWAWVYKPGDINPSLAQVAENHHRKPNPLSDYDAIVPMLNTHTIEEVAAQLHLPLGVVRAAVRLQKLKPELLAAARAGLISIGVAVALARKTTSVQARVYTAHLEAGGTGKITGEMVKEAAATSVIEAMPTLPIPDIPGGSGVQFGRAVDTEKGVKMIFWQDGFQREFVLPVQKLFELAGGAHAG